MKFNCPLNSQRHIWNPPKTYVLIWDLDKLNKLKPLLATAPVASKILLVSKVT